MSHIPFSSNKAQGFGYLPGICDRSRPFLLAFFTFFALEILVRVFKVHQIQMLLKATTPSLYLFPVLALEVNPFSFHADCTSRVKS